MRPPKPLRPPTGGRHTGALPHALKGPGLVRVRHHENIKNRNCNFVIWFACIDVVLRVLQGVLLSTSPFARLYNILHTD